MTTTSAATVADAQRILISVRERTTEVVAQIDVPDVDGDYGVLIPVPAEPVIDEQPVPVSDLVALDEATAPLVSRSTGGDSFRCGCGAGEKAGDPALVSVSEPVNVGPVAAFVLGAGDGAGLRAWLASKRFVILEQHQALLDEAVAEGNRFIAVERNDDAATDGPSSIGLHYTLPGDHRKLSLRFARLGAAAEVAFTVFVAAPETVGPTAPFATLTLADLDLGPEPLDYGQAVREAVKSRGGRAFVVESSTRPSAFAEEMPVIAGLFDPRATLTRASTLIAAEALDSDVSFTVPHPAVSRYASSELPAGATSVTSLGVLVALGALRKRSRRQRVERS